MNNDLVAYYADRAKEYEKIYEKPERQSDLLSINELLKAFFTGKEVFEIACGTGYWTQRIALNAKSVHATDINEPVLEIAKAKNYEKGNVSFARADFNNHSVAQPYESLFAGFIWSHIKLQDLNGFIDKVNSFVKPGGIVVFMDNNYVEDSNRPIINTDEQGNTYQERQLENGNKYSIVKNFPTEPQLYKLLEDRVEGIKFISLKYYWLLGYRCK